MNSSSHQTGLPPPSSKNSHLKTFLTYLKSERHYSPYTLRNYEHALNTFFSWLKNEKWDGQPSSITKNYLRMFIIECQKTHSRRTIHNWISAIRSFFEYLIKQKILERNPTTGLNLPKIKKTLPLFLTEKQMFDLLEAPLKLLRENTLPPFEAFRDRLVLELLYGGGLRISEVVKLTYSDVDFSSGIATVFGKGKKERLCPLGSVALDCLKTFKEQFTPTTHLETPILITPAGNPLSIRKIQLLLKKYLSFANLPQDISPHKIRHSYATHLLNRGANLRLVQALMGHASLSTTQIYTHLDIHRLKTIHAQTHPRS